jgi:hypothetical protein
MSDLDQIQALGQRLAAALVNAYGINMPGSNLVFLPGGVPVPNNIVQPMPGDSTKLIINPTQVQMFLSMNFDYPFAVTSGDASVLRIEASHGTATQIYTQAVTSAQPLGTADDAAWKRIAAEISAAKLSFGPPAAQTLICEPDDWAVPSAQYWTNFDSTESQSSSTTTPAPVPVVNRRLWMVRSFASTPSATTEQPPTSPSTPAGRIAQRNYGRFFDRSRGTDSPAIAFAAKSEQPFSAQANSLTSHPMLWQSVVDQGRLPRQLDTNLLFNATAVVTDVTTSSSSSIVIHLEHQCVTIGRYIAGQRWWDGVFLSDTGWFIPGMNRGGLLPPPNGTDNGASYGLPLAMIVVRNLRISGQWSQEAANVLGAPGGTVGPLSLFGAASKTESDGAVTFAHDGMQVVALLCSALPVLPPMDTPAPDGMSSSVPTETPSAPPSDTPSSPPSDTPSSTPPDTPPSPPSDGSSSPPADGGVTPDKAQT